MPPPVLVSAATTLDALATDVPGYARALIEEFWPGPLTLVCRQQPSLQWDLGDTRGTVAVRMPDHDVALELLERTGPLAVSSANLTGRPGGDRRRRRPRRCWASDVAVIVDAGRGPGTEASTIVDVTGSPGPRAAAAGRCPSTSSTRCSSRSAPPSRTRADRLCASTPWSSWSPPRSPTC